MFRFTEQINAHMKRIAIIFQVSPVCFFFIFFSLNFTIKTSFAAVLSTQGTVTGRVIDVNKFPLSGITVSINSAATTSDINGKFTLQNISTPYKAVVFDSITWTKVIYEELSIDNPDLILYGNAAANNCNRLDILVQIDSVPHNAVGNIKFVSKDLNVSTSTDIHNGEIERPISVSWPTGTKSITGTIFYLEKSGEAYTRYAEKTVTLVKNTYAPSYRLIDFISYKNLSPYTIPGYFATIQFDPKRSPSLTPYLDTGTPPELIYPNNNFTEVSEKTIFNYISRSGPGIFIVKFYSVKQQYSTYIITSATSVQFPETDSENKAKFVWDVSKCLSCFTVNDFVKSKPLGDEHFNIQQLLCMRQ